MLDRVSSWPKVKMAYDDEELVRELKAAQQQIFGGGDRLPSAGQLLAIGRMDLKGAICRSGALRTLWKSS